MGVTGNEGNSKAHRFTLMSGVVGKGGVQDFAGSGAQQRGQEAFTGVHRLLPWK